MLKLYPLLLIVCTIAASSCRESAIPGPANPRPSVASIERFGVQFSGEYRIEAMTPYQLMIIDPDLNRAGEADSLSRRGTLPVAYVNVGEAESYRWFIGEIRREWMLGPNPNWKDHYYLDARAQGWHTLLIDRVMPAVFSKGFKGVFLDMVDVASVDLYPALRPGMVLLIREIREAYPDKVIIINNGTFLASEVSDVIDGIVVESTFSTYDFGAKTYHPVTPEHSRDRCAELTSLMKTYGIKVFAIDYASSGDTLAAGMARREARRHGFLSFVGTIELNSLPSSTHHDR